MDEKLLNQRQLEAKQRDVEIEGFTFKIQRPDHVEFWQLKEATKSLDPIGIWRYYIRRFVVGWNLKTLDVIKGGDASIAPFSADVLETWLGDRPDVYGKLVDAVYQFYNEYWDQINADKKK